MPTYQYTCTECQEQLEVFQSFSDDPLTECPSCSGRLRKVFSPVGVVFKGSGFYRTDSRSSSSSNDKSATASKSNDTSSTSAQSSTASSNGSGSGGDSTKSSSGASTSA